MAKFRVLIATLNLPRICARHLFGKEHHPGHHMVVGTLFMTVGVAVSQVVGEVVHFPGSHFLCDMVGYGIHGIGLTPFIEAGMSAAEARE